MTNVREMTKTTISLLVLIVGLIFLSRWCRTLNGYFFAQLYQILDSKTRIGGYHSFILGLAFWLVLIAETVELIVSEVSGFRLIGSYSIPILFSCSIAVWALVAISSYVDLRWFWLFYYAGLTLCIHLTFIKLSQVKDQQSGKINSFLKMIKSKPTITESVTDYYVVFIVRCCLVTIWFVLLVSAVAFCIQYGDMFSGFAK